MSVQLVYHTEADEISPFDKRAIEIARNADLRIACPYLNPEYLNRLIKVSRRWELLTDIEEWLASLGPAARITACDFLQRNGSLIRHVAGLHAKVLIGANNALIGSANFTKSGIQCRTEMAVYLDNADNYCELVSWFRETWKTGTDIPNRNELDRLTRNLPERHTSTRPSLLGNGCRRNAPLMFLPPTVDILYYKGARGYLTGIGKEFCVMEGSKARGSVCNSFITNSKGKYNSIREDLIRRGILSRTYEWEDFVFTQDCKFTALSPAACIVSGLSRNGRETWARNGAGADLR